MFLKPETAFLRVMAGSHACMSSYLNLSFPNIQDCKQNHVDQYLQGCVCRLFGTLAFYDSHHGKMSPKC